MKKTTFTPLEIKKYSRKKKFLTGFTLIELLIVIVIIGILATISYPQFEGFQIRAKLKEVPNTVQIIAAAEKYYKFKTGDWYDDWAFWEGYADAENALHIKLPSRNSESTMCRYRVYYPPTHGYGTGEQVVIGFTKNEYTAQGVGYYVLDDPHDPDNNDTYHIFPDADNDWAPYLKYLE